MRFLTKSEKRATKSCLIIKTDHKKEVKRNYYFDKNAVTINYETTKSRLRERKIPMLECDYEVKQIDGDYAHLQRIDRPEEELKLVARALLPMEIYEGCILHYEMMQYTIVD